MKLTEIRMSKRLRNAINTHLISTEVGHVLRAMGTITEILEHLELSDHGYTRTWLFHARRLKALDKLCYKMLTAQQPYEIEYD